MPKICHRCGNVLEDAAAFCPHCGAPQIRVSVPETSPEDPLAPTFAATIIPTRQILWPRAFMAVFIPALAAAVLLIIHPLFLVTSLVWVALAGFFSTLLYRRRAPQALIDTRIGVRLGATVGFITFALISLLAVVEIAVSNASGPSFRQQLIDQMHQAAGRNPNPEAARMLDQFLSAPHALALAVGISALVFFVIFVLSGALGGALGGSSKAPKIPRL